VEIGFGTNKKKFKDTGLGKFSKAGVIINDDDYLQV